MSLIEYAKAIDVVQRYEKELIKNNKMLCKCNKCYMMFPFKNEDIRNSINNNGTSIYFGNCPYCYEEIELMRR